MKKIIASVAVAFLGYASAAQDISPAPACPNDGIVYAKINQCEAQGYVLQEVAYAVIDYFVEPEKPYQIGFAQFLLVPDCDPLEPCPRIAKTFMADVYLEKSGHCKYVLP